MSEVLVKIEKEVPVTIFEHPKIKVRVDTLFEEMEGDIKARFDEVKAFLIGDRERDKKYSSISYEQITSLFKIYFYKVILNEAVQVTFSEDSEYDIISNILKLLSKEELKKAILGEPMIYAFESATNQFKEESALGMATRGSKKLLLEKEFLGREIFK